MTTLHINKFRTFLFITVLLNIALFNVGGCDIDFGNSDQGSGSGTDAKIEGTITEITPDRTLDGIRVQITDDSSGVSFSDTTDINGIFSIEGDFDGTALVLEFLDENQDLLALTSVTVFPESEVDVGDLILTNGSVTFKGDIVIIYIGDLVENNCSSNVGTLVVENSGTEVIIQVSSSTDVKRDSDDLICEDLLIGETLEILGVLLTGNTLDAFQIDI